jgi:colanic acid/amylovoran biosynthesis glycosyltransferase
MHPPVEPPTGDTRPAGAPGTLRILSAGSLIWQQGFEHSIHAVRLLLDMGIPCEYRIIGDGEHVQAVAFARHQLGLGEHVHLISPNGDGQLPEELWSADVFVDPAVTDTTSPTPLAAAHAHGVPFVATARSTPLPEEAGITVPRRDPRAMAAALERLARNAELRTQMARAGPLVAGVSRSDHLAALERLYKSTLAEGTRP